MKGEWEHFVGRWKENSKKFAPTLLILAVGILLLALPEGEMSHTPEINAVQSQEFDLEQFERKLADILSRVEGAGQTQVVLTLDAGSRTLLAQDQKRAADGEISQEVVTVGRGSGEQEVVTLQTVSPSFRGAVVVCPGGDDPQVRLELIQAVTALTGLGADRIAVSRGNL